MRSRLARVRLLCLLVAAAGLTAAVLGQTRPAAPVHRQLIVVFDGLRPDYVTQAVMPNLAAFGARGVVYTNHHSVYPTVTRVNASSISTGSYPDRHGLLGNSVFFPQVDATRFLDTSDRAQLLRVNSATQGSLLTSPTLGEALESAGRRLLVVSAGSTGSAFLLNHKVSGGAIYHYDVELVAAPTQALNSPLPQPTDSVPSNDLNRWAVDTFLKALPKVDPVASIIWLTDPDTTAHEKGIGDPATVECLRNVDAQFKRLLDGLTAAGQLGDYNILVTSDHGFTTSTGGVALADVLKPFARPMPDGTPRIVSGGGAIYVRDRDRADVARIVAALQKEPRVGPIFTAAAASGSRDGWVPGTLSFEVIRWQHERSADILFSPNWDDRANAHGFRGQVATGGVAGHGSASPFDVHNVLMAAGPDIKRAQTLAMPSSNADLAPTVLRLLGMEVPRGMQGRVLSEAIAGQPAAGLLDVELHTTRNADGSYSTTASLSTIRTGLGRYIYFNSAKVDRRPY